MLLCWNQICVFQLLLFWYKLPQFLGGKIESFPQFVSNKSLTVQHFSHEYLQEVLGYESFCFENVLIFLSLTEVFLIM